MKVELGFLLKHDLLYYDTILKKKGIDNVLNCKIHDIYYTNKSLDNLTENQMKNACLRIRRINKDKFRIENKEAFIELREINLSKYLFILDKQLKRLGFTKVFDTYKIDHQYKNLSMNSTIQLQEIKDIGLLLYYDNPKYFNIPLDDQRNKLIDELNSFGFKFKYTDLGLDKLRTLYYKHKRYSKNQKG